MFTNEPPKPDKKIFDSIEEAKHALSLDGLGTVYVKANEVFVITKFGFGKFSRLEWEAKVEGYKWRK